MRLPSCSETLHWRGKRPMGPGLPADRNRRREFVPQAGQRQRLCRLRIARGAGLITLIDRSTYQTPNVNEKVDL